MKERQKIEFLYEVMYIALLEIREEAYNIQNAKIYKISDLIHNLPRDLSGQLYEEKPDYQSIFLNIKNRADNSNMTFWIDNIRKHMNLLNPSEEE